MKLILEVIIASLIGAVAGWVISRLKAKADAKVAGGVLDVARREAETILREARVAAQDEVHKGREVFEKETRERRQEVAEAEKRIAQRESNIERRAEQMDQKLEQVSKREMYFVERERELHKLQGELDELKVLSQREVQRVANLSAADAKKMLLTQIEDEVRVDAGALTRHIIEEAKLNGEREAKRVITNAIERIAANHVQSATSCTLTLPSEEMKGRIIGREGRNIRAFEAATGVNVLIDDTPQAVVLSGFDPVRREIARLTLERLIADGRINPARIEEEVGKVQQELNDQMQKAGEDAVFQLGLSKVHPEITKLLGRLRFRHSFAQNVLDHSLEVARVEGMIAAEIGLNQQIAKRVGLFHDIGKAVDHELEGSHALIGAELLRKYGEPEEVYQGVACHHHEAEPLTVYGVLCSAADAISASRPGARSESMELYLQRLEKLEGIANTFPGVEKSYALQAGREIRVLVEPGKTTDGDALQLARNISKKIEQELQYPGQIKVTVIRETRAVEYAK